MISYRPLRIYCMDHKLKLTNVVKECGLSVKYATRINNDENMEIRTLEKVCLWLGIPIECAVEFVEDKE